MRLKNRFNKRFLMRPLTDSILYRYDLDAFHWRITIMAKVDEINDKKFNQFIKKFTI